jgi:hypothetical protein
MELEVFAVSKPSVSFLINAGSRGKLELMKYPSGIAITDEPVVGISAVVSFLDDCNVVVDRVCILHRFATTDELRFAVGVPADELRNGGLRNDEAGIRFAKIILAGNDAGLAVHNHAVAVFGFDVKHYSPAFAVGIAGPVVMCGDDLGALCVATCGDECGAVAFGKDVWCVHRLLALIEPRNVVGRKFD